MKKRYTFAIFFSFIFLPVFGFIYGLICMQYHVFPYNQIQEIRNRLLDREPKEPPYGDITIINSSLQRLLLKSIEVEEDHSDNLFVRGGALGNLDRFLYVNTNRNDERKGQIIVFDTDNFHRMSTDGLAVPMGVEHLLDSSIMDIEDFPLFRFRVHDIHVDKTGELEHTLYVSHNIFHPEEKCISFNISRATVKLDEFSVQQLSDWSAIFTAEPCIYPEEDKNSIYPIFPGQMAGGPIVEYDDNHILVSVGSFHRDGIKFESLSMDSTSAFGKILLINKETGDYSIYARGLRNSQGLAIDSKGRIWATDHGPQGGDELNLVEKGKNFGWPMVSYGIEYSTTPWPHAYKQGSHDGYDHPVFAWLPSIAPTNIIEIKDGERFKLWKGDLIIGSLRDQSLQRMRIEGDSRVVYNEVIRFDHRIRNLTTLDDGRIVLITDEALLIIVDDGGPVYEKISEEVEVRIAELGNFDRLRGRKTIDEFSSREATARTIYMQHCSNCHYLQQKNEYGPHLFGIFDRTIGELDDFNYSNNLSENNQPWTPDLMKSFLLHPELGFRNTTMPPVSLTEAEADSIIQFLSIAR